MKNGVTGPSDVSGVRRGRRAFNAGSAAVLAAGCVAFQGAARAETKDWSATAADTAWATGANWVGTSAPVNDLVTDIARFNQTGYANQPTAGDGYKVNGLIFGDGTTAAAALTLSTGTQANRLQLGSGGIVVNANAGTATIGNAADQGILLGANQSWTNNSSSLLTIRSVGNINNTDATTPYTVTINGSGSGGVAIPSGIGNGTAVRGTGGSPVALVIDTTGSHVTTLGGTNTFTGGLTLNAGTLNANAANALGGAGNHVTVNGGTLNVAVSNLLTGGITLNAGTLSVTNGSDVLGTAANTLVINGGTIECKITGLTPVSVSMIFSNDFTLVGKEMTQAGPITLGKSVTFTNNAVFNLNGIIEDGGNGYSLTKAGSSFIRVKNANTYSGDTKIVGSGGMTLFNNRALQNSAFDTSGGGSGSVTLNTITDPVFGGLKGSKNLNSVFVTASHNSLTSLTLNPGAGKTHLYTGNIVNSTNVLALFKTGAGTQILAGTNSYAGATIISEGTLQIGNGGTAGQLGSLDVTNNATLVISRSDAHTITNLITGSGALVQQGSGTLTLAAQNTYTGATAVSNGVLRLTQTTSLSSSTDVSIASANGAKVNLDFSGTQTIRRLFINGELQTINRPVSRAQLPSALQGAGFFLPTEGAPPKGTVISFF